MKFFAVILLISLAQVASFFTAPLRTAPRNVVSRKFLFGNPEPSKNTPAKKEDKGGMFGGTRLWLISKSAVRLHY
jgi:hypothetical protein